LYLEELIVKLEASNFRGNWLVISFVEVLELERVNYLIASTVILGQSASPLNLLLTEFVILHLLFSTAAPCEAEAATEPLTICARQDTIEVECEKCEEYG